MKKKSGETKNSSSKILILLIIIVALSLVVDLLSLNTLYGISKSDGDLKGSLATNSYMIDWDYDRCIRGCGDYEEIIQETDPDELQENLDEYHACEEDCSQERCLSDCDLEWKDSSESSSDVETYKDCRRDCYEEHSSYDEHSS